MKTISIFQVQDINNLLKERQFDYILKLRDACGSQSLYLECTGEETDINILCNVINELLKNGFTLESICGLLGNTGGIYTLGESSINPGIWQNLTPNPVLGFGLFQGHHNKLY